jgi:hypothetical protein
MYLTKEVKDLYIVVHETWKKNLKRTGINANIGHIHELEEIIISFISSCYLKPSTESM